MANRFQFCIDGWPAERVRRRWEDAAHDAVIAGYAVWTAPDSIKLDTNAGGEIRRWTEE